MGESILQQDKAGSQRTRGVIGCETLIAAIGAVLHHASPDRKVLPVTVYRLGAVVIFALVLAVSADAQVVLHGNENPAGEARPATGSFSIRFPIPYKDVEYQGARDDREAASAVHMLSGVDSDGLKFTATETLLRQPIPPIDSYLETTKSRPGAVASDVQHQQKDGLEILSFALSEPNQDYFFRLIRSKTAGYLLVVQYPTGLRDKAIGMKDDFFGSFKIVPH
jgi:hypothetical protein